MAVPPSLLPSHSKKVLGAMRAERTVKRITFNPTSANPGETLYVSVTKLAVNEVIVPGSLALVFDINLKVTGAHANNYLVQNVSRALVDKFHVKFAATTVQETAGYDIYKLFEDLFLSKEERENMLREGIQDTDLNKLRSDAGDKDTSNAGRNTLNAVYGTKYRINLDHPILTDHGVFYPQALYNDLVFELTLAPASQVVKGSDPAKLGYKLENIELEYEVIRSKTLAEETVSTYASGKEFAYDLVMRERVVPITRGSETHLTIRVNPQRRSLKGLLLLFINPYNPGARDSEHYFNPDITKVKVTVNGVPSRVYNEGISDKDMWNELTRHFNPKNGGGSPNMTLAKYLTANKFGLWVDLRSMADTTMHGNGQRMVNTQGRGAARDRSKGLRLGHYKLPHLHRLRLADEHHGSAAGIGSVLETLVYHMAEAYKINFYPKPVPPTTPRVKSFEEIQRLLAQAPAPPTQHTSIPHTYGPKKTALQRPDCGAHQFR